LPRSQIEIWPGPISRLSQSLPLGETMFAQGQYSIAKRNLRNLWILILILRA
jgi:hypothetical protein